MLTKFMSPQIGSRRYTHTHLKWYMGTLVFSTLHCRNFSFFLFSIFFLGVHKKHKNAHKRITYFFLLRCLLSAFFIFVCLFAFLCFCLVAFLCFWCFFGLLVCAKSFYKKKIKSLKLPL